MLALRRGWAGVRLGLLIPITPRTLAVETNAFHRSVTLTLEHSQMTRKERMIGVVQGSCGAVLTYW